MKRILITGGAGFIGSHVAEAFKDEGYQVLVIDNLSTGKKENLRSDIPLEVVDIRELEKLRKIFKTFKPDVINHHAAQISVINSFKNPIEDIDTNIKGTLNLLILAKEFGIARFIFSSTGGALYGDPAYLPADENTLPYPLSPYGIDKQAAEHFIRIMAMVGEFEYVILRYGNVYGPRQDPFGEAGVVAIFTMRMLKGEKCIIYGDGNQERDFIYVKDVAKANLKALQYVHQNKEILPIFNIGTGQGITVNRIFNELARLTNYPVKPVYANAREGEVYKIYLSIERAREYLQWEPEYTLPQGLKETVEWFKSNL